jgi:hypothetical protein
MIAIHRTAGIVDPIRPSRRPRLAEAPEPPVRPATKARSDTPLVSFHPLILAVCRETRRFPADDPVELGPSIRDAALAAAEAVLGGWQLRDWPLCLAAALVESLRRLRELACCIEIARRLGYLCAADAAELLALQARAWRAVSALADLPTPDDRRETPEGPLSNPGS